MTLEADMREQAAEARALMRIGLPIVLARGERRAIVLPVETASPERLAALGEMGAPFLALTERRAATLRIPAYDGDMVRLALPPGADAAWLKAVADPARDLAAPLKGPFHAIRDDAEDLVAIARTALTLAKRAQLLPAVIVLPVEETHELPAFLPRFDADGLAALAGAALVLEEVSSARLPMEVSEAGRVHVFRSADGGEEHYAVEIGALPRTEPVLVRLHSACFTGDLLHSLKCDCGPQLRAALAQIGREGRGILLYLNQEGRGIGLANKMRAYALQDQGFDTVEANHRLGFEDDERDFRIGAKMLQGLGFDRARLMTNNPAKVEMLERAGVKVIERVPLKVGLNPHNRAYLATKARKSGHLL